jgi:hypothetical protein
MDGSGQTRGGLCAIEDSLRAVVSAISDRAPGHRTWPSESIQPDTVKWLLILIGRNSRETRVKWGQMGRLDWLRAATIATLVAARSSFAQIPAIPATCRAN